MHNPVAMTQRGFMPYKEYMMEAAYDIFHIIEGGVTAAKESFEASEFIVGIAKTAVKQTLL